jgi:hypothetical protein
MYGYLFNKKIVAYFEGEKRLVFRENLIQKKPLEI